MLQVKTLTLGEYRVNCYIVHKKDDHRCVVIDPGYEPERILGYLEEQDLSLQGVLLTHGHFDHVGAMPQLVEKTGCQLWLCHPDCTMPNTPAFPHLLPLEEETLPHPSFYQDGDTVELAGMSFHVIHTPGHSLGSVCLEVEDVLFTGDTLFAGTCGRTDLPGSSQRSIMESLARLKKLPYDRIVYPGHGYPTTLNNQRRSNPYLLAIED